MSIIDKISLQILLPIKTTPQIKSTEKYLCCKICLLSINLFLSNQSNRVKENHVAMFIILYITTWFTNWECVYLPREYILSAKEYILHLPFNIYFIRHLIYTDYAIEDILHFYS